MSVVSDAAEQTDVPRGERHLPDRIAFLRQLPFTVVTAIVVAGLMVVHPERIGSPLVLAAITVAIVGSVASFAVPWQRLHRWWAVVVPVADMVALALALLDGLDVAAGLALPVLWMSRSYGTVGMVASASGGTVVVWLPQLLGAPYTGDDLTRLIVQPPVLWAIGIYLYLSERRARARQRLLQRQSGIMHRTLAASRRQQRVLEGVLNTIDVGVVAIDAESRVTVRNRAQEQLAPWTPVVGAGLWQGADDVQLYEADRRTPVPTEQTPMAHVLRGEQVHRELFWWHDEGEWHAIRVTASSLLDERARPDGAVVVHHDLTAEMAAMAQQDDFVATVSHELRTPLTSILGYAEILAEAADLTDRQRRHVGIIERNAQRLLRMIGDLLTAGQINRGALALEIHKVDLEEIVTEAVEAETPRARRHRVSVDSRCDRPVFVLGDAARLRQVVDNILSNAIKYSTEGGQVTLRAVHTGGQVVLTVRDDGIGVASEEQEQLFRRFYRAHAVRGDVVQGTGLGLHIAQRIVQAHGGSIKLRSELGRGTEVMITLPGAP